MSKTLLITGGAGFIGANFVRRFLDLGYDVNVMEKKGTDLWRIRGIEKRIKIHYLDLRNREEVESLISKIKPQVILHFAAYGAYQGTQQDLEKTVETNFLGTVNLVKACSREGFECFINTGSSSEYGIKENPMKEKDLLEPNNLYGIIKATATMFCQNEARMHNLPIAIARPFAVYGYFEEKGRLIPTVIKSCLENSKLELSSPGSVRDFVFIEDLIGAYSRIIENISRAKGEVFNIGTGKQSSIGEVVQLAKKITGSSIDPQYQKVRAVQHEPRNWVADISKIKRVLGWHPEHNLESGMRKNIEWFKKNLSLY